MRGLIDANYDVELTGFDTLDIDTMLSFDTDEKASDDDVHLPESKPAVFRVGDARDPAAYQQLLEGKRAQLIFTDPPYGCAIANNVSGVGKVKHDNFVLGAGETLLPEFGATILRPAFKCMARHTASGAIAFVCTDWRAAPHLLDAVIGVQAARFSPSVDA